MKTVPKLYWIDGPWRGRLAVSSRPRGGDWLEDEIAGWRSAGVDVVACLLTPEEVDDLQLTREASLAAAESIAFHSLPIPDRDVPFSESAVVVFARHLAEELARISHRRAVDRSGGTAR